MSAGRMIGSLMGAFGGRAVGGMIGGSKGRMVGSLLGSVLGARGAGGGLGAMLGGAGGGDDSDDAVQMDDAEASVLIRAMTNSAKADGNVDQSEIDAIIARAGDLDDAEQAFLRSEFAAPLDLTEFVRSVPKGMEADVYAASLMPIDIDTAAEKKYLSDLAAGLGLSAGEVRELHDAVGI